MHVGPAKLSASPPGRRVLVPARRARNSSRACFFLLFQIQEASTVTLWSENSPAWEVNDRAAKVAARYPVSGVLASGWLLGERYLAGKAAMVDVPMGRGHVILFGMRPQYRAQSYQNFKLFFNALLYGAGK